MAGSKLLTKYIMKEAAFDYANYLYYKLCDEYYKYKRRKKMLKEARLHRASISDAASKPKINSAADFIMEIIGMAETTGQIASMNVGRLTKNPYSLFERDFESQIPGVTPGKFVRIIVGKRQSNDETTVRGFLGFKKKIDNSLHDFYIGLYKGDPSSFLFVYGPSVRGKHTHVKQILGKVKGMFSNAADSLAGFDHSQVDHPSEAERIRQFNATQNAVTGNVLTLMQGPRYVVGLKDFLKVLNEIILYGSSLRSAQADQPIPVENRSRFLRGTPLDNENE